MSATDLDRYLTDEAVEKAARALWDEPGWEQATHEQRQHHREAAERALSAYDGIIQQAKAEAWDESAQEAHDLGWLHGYARVDVARRNPYRADIIHEEKR